TFVSPILSLPSAPTSHTAQHAPIHTVLIDGRETEAFTDETMSDANFDDRYFSTAERLERGADGELHPTDHLVYCLRSGQRPPSIFPDRPYVNLRAWHQLSKERRAERLQDLWDPTGSLRLRPPFLGPGAPKLVHTTHASKRLLIWPSVFAAAEQQY